MKIVVPLAVKWVGLAFNLEVTLRFDRLLYPNQLLTGLWVGKTLGFPLAMGKVALGDPTAGFVRVTGFGPAIHPAPDVIVELVERLAADDMAVVVRPAA